MKLVILVFVFIIFLLTILYSLTRSTEHYNTQSPSIDLVIARYNEDLEWVRAYNEKYRFSHIYVYNKGPNENFYKGANNIIVINSPNVGRENHAYMSHIITHYSNLADITIFVQGSADQDNKVKRTTMAIDNTFKTYDSSFPAVATDDLKTDFYDFKVDNYQSTNEANKELNPETNMQLSTIRPFGDWFTKWFGDIKIKGVTYTGIFSASRQHIHNRSLQFYKSYMKNVDSHSNPEAGHYMERSWIAVFHPIEPKHILFE